MCVGVWLVSNMFQKISWDFQSKIHYSFLFFLHLWTHYSFLFSFFFFKKYHSTMNDRHMFYSQSILLVLLLLILCHFCLFVWKSILLNFIHAYLRNVSKMFIEIASPLLVLEDLHWSELAVRYFFLYFPYFKNIDQLKKFKGSSCSCDHTESRWCDSNISEILCLYWCQRVVVPRLPHFACTQS